MADLRDQLQSELGDAYAIERELGGGGMSRVFLAQETRFRRKVVIKVLAPELAAGVSAERFEREIRLAAGLQQANIVPVLTAGEVAGLPYFTMPYVDGESLRAKLSTNARMSIEECVGILRDVTRALSYAHRHGVIHRDIKPENVLLSGGAAVVTDFGIAKAIDAARSRASEATLTQLGSSVGTPSYMAPEQAAGRAHLVGHLAPRIAGLLDRPGRRAPGLLALEDADLIAATGGSDEARAFLAGFVPRRARERMREAELSGLPLLH
ncbi:MAG: serine/threonine-protein kinase, partial [Gemmatimonadaceae bacterium]